MTVVECNSVDAVVSTKVLCSVTDVDRCLTEILRVLKPVSFTYCTALAHTQRDRSRDGVGWGQIAYTFTAFTRLATNCSNY